MGFGVHDVAGGRVGRAGVLLQCAGCGHQSSVTAGTIFQDTRKPLTLWFRAMWAVTSQKNGASAIGIQRELGLGSYDSHGATGSESPRGIGGSRRDLSHKSSLLS